MADWSVSSAGLHFAKLGSAVDWLFATLTRRSRFSRANVQRLKLCRHSGDFRERLVCPVTLPNHFVRALQQRRRNR
jgi:hypothetical protein